MALITAGGTDEVPVSDRAILRDPAFQAFALLRTVFTVAPILFGLDKFGHVLVDWDRYLAPEFVDALPGTAHELRAVSGPCVR